MENIKHLIKYPYIFQTYLIIRKYSVTIVIVLIPLYVTSCDTRMRQCQNHRLSHRLEHASHRNRRPSVISIIHPHNHRYHRHIRNLSEVDSIFIHREIIRVTGERLCPTIDDINSSVVQMCPSYVAIEYDENRNPPVMRQVKCRCPSSCLGPFTEEQPIRQCVPILTYELVLRVVGCDESNYYEYAQVWEPKSVGCECRILTEEEQRRNSYVMPP